MRKPCKIDGCDNPSAGRGWCQKHWTRWRHCPYCDERAAIVAWLRECAQRYADMYGQPVDSLPAHMYAGWIERGEHVKGTDDSSHVSGTCKEGCDDE